METILAHWRQLRPNPLNAMVRGPIGEDGIGELAESLRENEVVQPLVVCRLARPAPPPQPSPVGTGEGEEYMIIAGERRWRAAMALGDQAPLLPCVVRPAMDEMEQLVVMGVENLQREELNAVQEARYYGELRRRGMGDKEIARRTGMKLSRVKDRLEILELDERVQELIAQGALPVTARRSLVRLEADEQAALAEKMRGRSWVAIERAVQIILERREREATIVRGNGNGNGHGGEMVEQPKPPATITNGELELAVRATCAACEVHAEMRHDLAWEDVGRALDEQCEGCNVRALQEACRQCPLVDFLRAMKKLLPAERGEPAGPGHLYGKGVLAYGK